MRKLSQHLVTLYTRTPLHIGCGTSVDVVDLPIMRERITGFPVIPGSSLKGVLRDQARHASPDELTMLFGDDSKDGSKHAG
jgi:CRISPR-associated protein Cmr4